MGNSIRAAFENKTYSLNSVHVDQLESLMERVELLDRKRIAREEHIVIYQVSCYIANTVRERLFGKYWPWSWSPGLTLDVVVKDLHATFIDHSAPILEPNFLGLICDSSDSRALLEEQFLAVWTLFSHHVDFLKVSKLMSEEIGEEEFEEVTDEYVVENPPPFLDQLSRCKEEFSKGSAQWDSDVFSSPFKTFLEVHPQYKAEDLQQLMIAFFVLLNDSDPSDVDRHRHIGR